MRTSSSCFQRASLTLDFFGFETVRQGEENSLPSYASCALQGAPIRMFDTERSSTRPRSVSAPGDGYGFRAADQERRALPPIDVKQVR